MQKLLIEHVKGLHGIVKINGAKNSVLPIMAAALLSDETSTIDRVPLVTDVTTMSEILRGLGVDVLLKGNQLKISPGKYQGTVAAYDLVSQMRASICVLGPLLAKKHKACVSMPGGCVIGPRPIDLHIKGMEALGAKIVIEHGYLVAHCTQLKGTKIHLGGSFGPSVLATGNVMMAATLAQGTSIIEHAACEPEVIDLANFLNTMGAHIEGQGSPVIRIKGVKRLHGVRYKIIPDRIEAGTFMIAAAMLRSKLLIDGVRPEHLGSVIDKLAEANVSIEKRNGAFSINAKAPLRAVDITTLPFPGFPTDLQAPMMALMAVTPGTSMITEKVYPERFMHVAELSRMGAQISRVGSSAVIKGVKHLSGAPVAASDLRGSAALILSGMIARNRTELVGVEHLLRGYQNIEEQLRGVGAKIKRVEVQEQK